MNPGKKTTDQDFSAFHYDHEKKTVTYDPQTQQTELRREKGKGGHA